MCLPSNLVTKKYNNASIIIYLLFFNLILIFATFYFNFHCVLFIHEVRQGNLSKFKINIRKDV